MYIFYQNMITKNYIIYSINGVNINFSNIAINYDNIPQDWLSYGNTILYNTSLDDNKLNLWNTYTENFYGKKYDLTSISTDIDYFLNKYNIADNIYNNYYINGIYNNDLIKIIISQIKSNILLNASFTKTKYTFDYIDQYKINFYESESEQQSDKLILDNIYSGEIKSLNNIKSMNTFLNLLSQRYNINVIIYGYYQIKINQYAQIKSNYINLINPANIINDNIYVSESYKYVFKCIIIENDNNNYLSYVELIEDYFANIQTFNLNIVEYITSFDEIII